MFLEAIELIINIYGLIFTTNILYNQILPLGFWMDQVNHYYCCLEDEDCYARVENVFIQCLPLVVST